MRSLLEPIAGLFEDFDEEFSSTELLVPSLKVTFLELIELTVLFDSRPDYRLDFKILFVAEDSSSTPALIESSILIIII